MPPLRLGHSPDEPLRVSQDEDERIEMRVERAVVDDRLASSTVRLWRTNASTMSASLRT
jgi:hypothetical protein